MPFSLGIQAVPVDSLSAIGTANWSLALDSSAGGGRGSGIGKVVEGLSDINQSIQIILTTIPGEDPWRPTFGCDITRFIDKPIEVASAGISGVVTQAIAQYEPRVKVLAVSAQADPSQPGRLVVTVNWQPNLSTNQPSGAIGIQKTIVSLGTG
jgi:phage baseplate assembly protein W